MLLLPANAVNRSAPLNRGLVSWWLHLPNRLGGGGNTFRDLMGRNHGTMTGGPTWRGAFGRPGGFGTLYFDGTDDHIDLGHAGLDSGDKLTMAVWVKIPTAGTQYSRVIEKGANSNWLLNRGQSHVNKLNWIFYGQTTSESTAELCDNTWHHIVGTLNGTANKLYVDGLLDVSTVMGSPFAANTDALNIGHYGAGGYYLNFSLDDLRLYNRDLSSSEIAGLYQASRLGYRNELNWISRPAYGSQDEAAPSLAYIIGGGVGSGAYVIGA